MVIVPEALFVKNHIVNTFDLPEIEALKATLRQRLLEIEGKDAATRQTQALACGLLRDSVCSALDGCPVMYLGANSERFRFVMVCLRILTVLYARFSPESEVFPS